MEKIPLGPFELKLLLACVRSTYRRRDYVDMFSREASKSKLGFIIDEEVAERSHIAMVKETEMLSSIIELMMVKLNNALDSSDKQKKALESKPDAHTVDDLFKELGIRVSDEDPPEKKA